MKQTVNYKLENFRLNFSRCTIHDIVPLIERYRTVFICNDFAKKIMSFIKPLLVNRLSDVIYPNVVIVMILDELLMRDILHG